MINNNQENLKKALKIWLDQRGISVTEFSKTMGYTYNHSYQLINGNLGISESALGRILLYYGSEVAGEITDISETLLEPQS